MATSEAIRGRVRTRLEEATAAVWTDDEIDECVSGALGAYGWRFPVEVIATAAVSEGATTAAAPAGMQALQRVIQADGTVVPRRGRPTGSTAGEQQAWELYGGLLHFTQPLSAQTITIWHTAAPTLADVPAEDDGLLVLGAVVQALQARAVQDYKLGGQLGLASSNHVTPRDTTSDTCNKAPLLAGEGLRTQHRWNGENACPIGTSRWTAWTTCLRPAVTGPSMSREPRRGPSGCGWRGSGPR